MFIKRKENVITFYINCMGLSYDGCLLLPRPRTNGSDIADGCLVSRRLILHRYISEISKRDPNQKSYSEAMPKPSKLYLYSAQGRVPIIYTPFLNFSRVKLPHV